MFLSAAPGEPALVTLTYVQGPEQTLSAYVHHLESYLCFFRQLAEFRFLFLARNDAHFARAAELFRSLVTIPLESTSADDLLRYFAVRKTWDQGDYAGVSESDLVFRNLARERFRGARFEHFYRAWKGGRIGDSDIRREFQASEKPLSIEFQARILKRICGPVAQPQESSRVS
jgi:hypothetical protein